MKRTVYTRVEQFLRDDDFIRYVLDCVSDNECRWSAYLSAAPPVRSAYLKACDILTHLDDCDLLTPEETLLLKQRVFNTLHGTYN